MRDVANPEALKFNSDWIWNVRRTNTPVYNIGRSGYSIFYNKIEMPAMYNYSRMINVNTFEYFGNRLRFSAW